MVAASVPLLLALTAVIATIGLIGPISHLIGGVDSSINEVILLIGLAVGVDYSMFYLRREREERESGRSESASLAAAAATSGRAVMISGFTVIIAMAGMYLAGTPTFESFATGTILVVAVAMVGSLTVLPALLAWLGDRVEKGGVPIISRMPWNARESGLWSRVVNRVLRHPVISVVLAGGLLVVLSIPAFSLHTADQSIETLPQDLEAIQTYNKIQAAFPGGPIPATLAVSADDVTAPPVRRGLAELRAQVLRQPDLFKQPITTDVNAKRTLAQIDIPIAGDGSDSKSNAALAELRDDLIPATIGSVPGVTADVTGYTASSKDFNDTTKSHVPLVFGFVLTAAFLLLLFTFRSIVIPIKAIVLNMLSVGAAYGVLVWLFQYGHGEDLLGFKSNGSIISWMPLFLFVILFGLSMDYHVFILTRIREAFDRGMSTDEAVSHGIKTTAGVITSAAVVMVVGLRDLRHALADLLQGARRRAGGGGVHRRDDRPRGAVAGLDEAAGRRELVPAELARVAAAGQPGGRRPATGERGGGTAAGPEALTLNRGGSGPSSSSVPIRRTTAALSRRPICRRRARGSSSFWTWAVPSRQPSPTLIRTRGSARMLEDVGRAGAVLGDDRDRVALASRWPTGVRRGIPLRRPVVSRMA